ncbi:MAG TPA: alginate lyase family protein [Bryobacteraceae bacterium]
MTCSLPRRRFLASLAAAMGAARAFPAPIDDSLIMVTAQEAAGIRNALSGATGRIGERIAQLRSQADNELKRGPWSVTFHRPNDKFDPHDYFSEGPYFWPDPKNPNGPYIRRDGERNPQRFEHNHNDLGAMATSVLTLGAAAYLFGEDRYAQHAAENLSTWFLDAATRMNPNLEHGQAIRGVNDGRGTGLIDTVSLIHCCQGVLLLEKAGKLDASAASELRDWFGQFLAWMTTSAKGKQEGKSGNNHATWWTAQVAAYATLTRNRDAFQLACDRYKTYLVPEEIQPDGSCPREEARTNSLSYSVFNADAFATLCRIAQSGGVDLWRFQTPNGVSYEKLVRYVEPYVLHPDRWKKKQISKYNPNAAVFLGLAGAGLHAPDLIEAYKTLPRSDSAWVALIDLITLTRA